MPNSHDQIEVINKPAKAKAEINLAQLLESRSLERCPFPMPVGWFFVFFS
ncbi:MAG: Phenylpropionate dioxygenase, large terminal subunit, partial [Nevskia sp.]|nr:Phenylpropionate dioxygenase, large terminal subunit [Nevskia sp.]